MPSLALPSPPHAPGTTIPYAEYVGRGAAESPRGRLSTDQVTATQVFEVAWDNLFDFARACVGYPILKEGIDGSTTYRWVERRQPMKYQALQSATGGEGGGYDLLTLHATDVVEWHGVGAGEIDPASQVARYPRARLTVLFSTLTYDVATDAECIPPAGSPESPLAAYGKPDEGWFLKRHFTRFWRPAQRVDFLPFGAMQTVDDATAANRLPVRKGVPQYVPMADLTYVQHGCPYVPSKAIQGTVGKVNSTAFDEQGAPPGYPAGTLLCLTPDIQPYFSPVGTRLYNLVWRFRWLANVDASGTPRGWNYFYYKKPGVTPAAFDYVRLSSTGTTTGTPMYRSAEFRDLFRPDWN